MITFPNCKINLGLKIIGKRPDGYHNISTIFYPIHHLNDVLEIVPSSNGETTLHLSGIGSTLLQTPDNLILKAYRLLKTEFNLPEVEIHLHKHIPFGAGLGGGSADAAFTLKLLNNMFSLNLSSENLHTRAAQLGSDCPFFISNTPIAAIDKGDQFIPIPSSLSLKDKYIVIVKPDVSVSTAEAYSLVKVSPNTPDPLSAIQQSQSEWKKLLINDFEAPIAAKNPVIAAIKQKLYDQGAFYAAMSGSGSAVFGLFEKEPQLDAFFSSYFTFSAVLL